MEIGTSEPSERRVDDLPAMGMRIGLGSLYSFRKSLMKAECIAEIIDDFSIDIFEIFSIPIILG